VNRNEIGVAGFVGGVPGGVSAFVVSRAQPATMASGLVGYASNAIANGATGGNISILQSIVSLY
jgi:hypothetical protein